MVRVEVFVVISKENLCRFGDNCFQINEKWMVENGIN